MVSFCYWTRIAIVGNVAAVVHSLPARLVSPLAVRLPGPRAAAQASAPHARLGAGVALTGLVLVGVGAATHSSLVIAPFAATASLKHAAPRSPLAQPRNILGGYLVGTLVGVAIGLAVGPTALATVAAAALAAVLLMALHVEHPPAVAMAVVAVQAHTPHTIQIALVGAITMTLTMALLAPALHRERWPRRIARA